MSVVIYPRIVESRPYSIACVIQLANHYVAINKGWDVIEFISKYPETDLGVAQTAATLFAKAHDILCSTKPQGLDRPIITVLKSEGKWVPAELHPDRIKLITEGSDDDPGFSALKTALNRELLYIPQFGVWLSESSTVHCFKKIKKESPR